MKTAKEGGVQRAPGSRDASRSGLGLRDPFTVGDVDRGASTGAKAYTFLSSVYDSADSPELEPEILQPKSPQNLNVKALNPLNLKAYTFSFFLMVFFRIPCAETKKPTLQHQVFQRFSGFVALGL